jgi:hypothetical protein
MPIQSGTAENMTSLLLKLAALLGGGPPQHGAYQQAQQAGAGIVLNKSYRLGWALKSLLATNSKRKTEPIGRNPPKNRP